MSGLQIGDKITGVVSHPGRSPAVMRAVVTALIERSGNPPWAIARTEDGSQWTLMPEHEGFAWCRGFDGPAVEALCAVASL